MKNSCSGRKIKKGSTPCKRIEGRKKMGTTNHKLERHLVSFIKEGKNEKLFLAS